MISGITLITVPTIQYGGYFLLTSLMDRTSGYMENPLRQNFFRAGHAHAGVFVLLSLVCQMLADSATLPDGLLWLVRIGVPAAAIVMPLGFFLAMPSPHTTAPNRCRLADLCGSGVARVFRGDPRRRSAASTGGVKR